MECPDRNVGGAFWNGLDAELVGAEPLATVQTAPNDNHSRAVIQFVKEHISKTEGADRIDAYFVSLFDIMNIPEQTLSTLAALGGPAEHLSTKSPLIVARIWPNAAFMGARDGGCVDEEQCRDYWFDASSCEFMCEAKFSETDLLIEADR